MSVGTQKGRWIDRGRKRKMDLQRVEKEDGVTEGGKGRWTDRGWKRKMD